MAYTTTSTAKKNDGEPEGIAVSTPADQGQEGILTDAERGVKEEGSGSADGGVHKIGHDSPAGLPYTGSITADPDGTSTPNHDVPDGAILLSSGPRTRPDVLIGNEGAVQANMQVEAMPPEIVLDERYDRILYADLSVAHVEKGEDDPRPERGQVERTPGGTREPVKVEGVSVVEDPELAEKVEAKSDKADAKTEAKVEKVATDLAADDDPEPRKTTAKKTAAAKK